MNEIEGQWRDDQELYEALSVPRTREACVASLKTFLAGVESLRKEHAVPEVCLVAVAYCEDDAVGIEGVFGNAAHHANLLRSALKRAIARERSFRKARKAK